MHQNRRRKYLLVHETLEKINRNKCLVFAGLNCQTGNICCSCVKRTDVIQWRILPERLSLNRRKNKNRDRKSQNSA